MQDRRFQPNTSVIRAAALLLAVAAVAAVLIGTSQEEQNSALLETNLHYYLGDHQALSAEDARKQANSFFDSSAKKQRLRHAAVAKKSGLSDVAARQDLSSFFDTLGLNGNKHKETARENVNVKVTKKNVEAKKAPQVNIYINEKHVTEKKQIIKQAAAAKKAAPKPVEKKARKVQLANKPVESRFDREMKEAKQLLKGSKMEQALSQARTLSLKSEAPYYTS